jgi:hypothetical protein
VIAFTTTYRNNPMPRKTRNIEAALVQAIKASGLTHYALGKASGISASVLDRFMLPEEDPRHRGINLATAAKIAEALRLELRGA